MKYRRTLTERFVRDFFEQVNRYREAKIAKVIMPARMARHRHLHALACQITPRGVNVETKL
jgi:hypothetical protein